MCRDGPDSSLGRVMRQPPPEIPGLSFVQRLGSGGFADVHLYRQELPQMLVAVKVLRTASGDLREQLVAEAAAVPPGSDGLGARQRGNSFKSLMGNYKI